MTNSVLKSFFLFLLSAFVLSGCAQLPQAGETITEPVSHCSLKPEPGRCKAAFPRFYYDHESQSCQSFTWGGCGGVVPFETRMACESRCVDSSGDALGKRLEAGWIHWQKAKEARGADYRYTTEFQSWAGFGNRTTLIITNDQVSERHYESWGREPNSTRQWKEQGSDELGSHKEGASLKTMDQLYSECREDVLTKNRGDFELRLRLGTQGEIKSCTYRHKHCADDCTQGISTRSFEFTESM